ncbi:MAG TPA: DedA family protein [Mycobacteriales bacterium]|nr:DedA family protein [Mycobacteriales bacterium]
MIMDFVHGLMSSPWIYALIFAIAAVDGFFPALPSESMVMLAGVFAVTGTPNLALVIVAGAFGAICGDHVSYGIGRGARGHLHRRMRAGRRRHAAFSWAGRMLDERGPLILVVARYVPGGRTAATMTAGAVGYRVRPFSFFTCIAGLSWALYCVLLGYLGGKAFENNPLLGLIASFALMVLITVVVEVVRRVRGRSIPGAAETARIAAESAKAPERVS